jgi:hypothetical protein
MSENAASANEISLWECLHDGVLEGIASDLLARTLTFVIDVPFHWEFNGLPPSTRFHINLADVLTASALTFVPWPGRHTDLTAAQYELGVEESSKGRLQSVEWNDAFSKLERTGEYRVSGASFTQTRSAASLLRLEGSVDTAGDYYELRIEARQVQFSVGQSHLSPEDFAKFGERYWQAFSERAAVAQDDESEV